MPKTALCFSFVKLVECNRELNHPIPRAKDVFKLLTLKTFFDSVQNSNSGIDEGHLMTFEVIVVLLLVS